MVKPSFEERLIGVLTRIESSISSLSHTLNFIDERKRFPIVSPSEEVEKQLKEKNREYRAEAQIEILHKQNEILTKTVIVAVIGIMITAIVGIIEIVLRVFFNR
jgi:hypothetical protein